MLFGLNYILKKQIRPRKGPEPVLPYSLDRLRELAVLFLDSSSREDELRAGAGGLPSVERPGRKMENRTFRTKENRVKNINCYLIFFS